MLKLIKLIPILILISGCSGTAPQAALPNQVNFIDIMGIVFDGQSSRLENTGDYEPISGAVAAVFQGTDHAGTFQFSYANFSQPTFCAYQQNCTCMGILKGSFVATGDPNATSTAPAGPPPPYNPTTPPPDTTVPTPDPTITTTFIAITIDFQNSSLSPTCPPQTNRTVKIQLHNDQTMVYSDLGKDLVLVPRTYSNN